MLGKTKDGAQATGARLQAKNNKWYRYVAQVQVLAFAVMHLILGVYFAFVSSEYANNAGFTGQLSTYRGMIETNLKANLLDICEILERVCEQLEAHLYMDQICAIICFVLVALWLDMFGNLRKNKNISVLYYVGMAVSVVLPFVYMAMSHSYIVSAMTDALKADQGLLVEGVGNANDIVFWTGIKFGSWVNTAEMTAESQIVLDYLRKLGVESGKEIALADFDLSGLLTLLRNDKYNWNIFALYSYVNAALSVAFVACTAVFVPLKKNVLVAKLLKK